MWLDLTWRTRRRGSVEPLRVDHRTLGTRRRVTRLHAVTAARRVRRPASPSGPPRADRRGVRPDLHPRSIRSGNHARYVGTSQTSSRTRSPEIGKWLFPGHVGRGREQRGLRRFCHHTPHGLLVNTCASTGRSSIRSCNCEEYAARLPLDGAAEPGRPSQRPARPTRPPLQRRARPPPEPAPRHRLPTHRRTPRGINIGAITLDEMSLDVSVPGDQRQHEVRRRIDQHAGSDSIDGASADPHRARHGDDDHRDRPRCDRRVGGQRITQQRLAEHGERAPQQHIPPIGGAALEPRAEWLAADHQVVHDPRRTQRARSRGTRRCNATVRYGASR